MAEDWEPDDSNEDAAPKAPETRKAAPAPAPKPEDAPITQGQANELFARAQAAAKTEMVKEANLTKAQSEIDALVDQTLRKTSTEWFDRQPQDVRVAARNVVENRIAARDDVSKLSDKEFRTELEKAAQEVAREMSGTVSEKTGTAAELETRLEANRNAGETGVNKNAPTREPREELDLDRPRWGASEHTHWATDDQVEQELHKEIRAANG